jgi:poly-gamma-glutamate synthesis protein (capsule biosynthesis protein)
MYAGLAALSVLWCLSCTPTEQEAIPSGPEIQLAVVGQALLKFDPREYYEQPMKTVRPILKSADLAFTNLEVAVNSEESPCEPTRSRSLHSVKPSVVDFLYGMNFGLQSLANNHSWDLGECGILETLKTVKAMGLAYAGTGENLAQATSAGITVVKDIKFALVAAATVRLVPEALPTESKPGVNLIRVGNQEDWDRNIASIKKAAGEADVVIVYQHFQISDEDVQPGNRFEHGYVEDLQTWQREWAHAVIDAGASVYIAHGAREFQGIEIYRGRPVFFGLGGFIYQSNREVGHYAYDVWESLLAMMTIREGHVRSIEFTPLALDEGTSGPLLIEKRGLPEVAVGSQASSILVRLAEFSKAYGTEIRVDSDSMRAYLEIPE